MVWKLLFENAAIIMYNVKYVGLCSEVHVSHRGDFVAGEPTSRGQDAVGILEYLRGSSELYYWTCLDYPAQKLVLASFYWNITATFGGLLYVGKPTSGDKGVIEEREILLEHLYF